MGCNPCCCWSIRDGAVTIGIWSVVYSFASLALFGWQFAVLNNCRSVTMAQSNLQCEYYCPCVGASTSRTSSLIEGTTTDYFTAFITVVTFIV
uniref:7TM_GPCR_Srx domain-containing protein n=1 Tax=Syphacia muris TaxID=451379 RepID=A0A0N5ALT0_9BILA